MTTVEFKDPAGNIVEKVSIVGDGNDGAGIALQVLFQPGYGFCIEMVGRLIEEENVGFLE